jgi:hypothetical protein
LRLLLIYFSILKLKPYENTFTRVGF